MILITGGAGYVGRNVARALGKNVTLLDDFRTSPRAAAAGWPLIEADLAVARVDWSSVDAVIHCAASLDVADSVRNPALYWWNNVAAPLAFFRQAGRKKVIFSSTAAVYGEPERWPISEDAPRNPINPYGRSKLACEAMLRDLGLDLTILRYFNAAGGDEDHRPETHLIPNIVRAALRDEPVPVYGDGSCVRDFIHVEDLARAHVLALERPGVYNLGSGRGYTILEVIRAAERVTGRRLRLRHEPPRPGDPKVLVADISRARRELGWEPRRSLEEIIDSTYRWRREHPDGYGG